MKRAVSGKSAGIACLIACAAALSMLAVPSSANVYATDLKFAARAVDGTAANASVDLSFRLNEAADTSVKIEIFNARTSTKVREAELGARPRGVSTWTWDLKDGSGSAVARGEEYYFKVTASDPGHTVWEQISSNDDWGAKYPLPWSVAVNNDPASPYFGRIYVTNSYTGETSVPPAPQRNLDHGIYAVNADLTDATGLGDVPMTGNIIWPEGSLNPFNVEVGDDGKVYVCDNWDGFCGVWVAPPDLTGTWLAILDPEDASNYYPFAAAPPAIHGSVSSCVVKGKGLNRCLYTVDEDLMVPGDDPNGARSNSSIWKYELGPNDRTIRESPSVLWSDFPNDYLQDFGEGIYGDLATDKDGNFFITCYTWHPSGPPASVLKIAPDGNAANNYAPLWNPVTAWGTDPLVMNCKGVAVDDLHGRIVTVQTWGATDWATPGTFSVFSANLAQDSLVTVPLASVNGSDARPRGIACDAVGNVYVVDNNVELLRIYSPPDGANSFTTQSAGRFTPASGSAQAPASPVITVPASSTSLTTLTASWTATGAAYRYAISVTQDDQQEYVKGWTDTTSTSITETGLSLTSGVTYYWFVQAKSATGVWSDVAVSSGTAVQAPATIGAAKALSDVKLVVLKDKVVTKISGNDFFVQEQDRSAGIRVAVSGGTAAVAVNSLASIIGTLGTSGAERFINAEVSAVTPGSAFAAVPLQTRASDAAGSKVTGAAGLPDDGLLVTVAGKVTETDFFSYLIVDDGSVVLNDSLEGKKGIKIDLTTSVIGALPMTGQYAKITGVVRALQAGEKTVAVVQPRDDADIVVEQ